MPKELAFQKIAQVNIKQKGQYFQDQDFSSHSVKIIQSSNNEYLVIQIDNHLLLIQIPSIVLLNMYNDMYQFCFSPSSKFLAIKFQKLEKDELSTIMIYNLQKRSTVWLQQFEGYQIIYRDICYDHLDNLYIGAYFELIKVTPALQVASQYKGTWFNSNNSKCIIEMRPFNIKNIFIEFISNFYILQSIVCSNLMKVVKFKKQNWNMVGEIFKNIYLFKHQIIDKLRLKEMTNGKLVRFINWKQGSKGASFLLNHTLCDISENNKGCQNSYQHQTPLLAQTAKRQRKWKIYEPILCEMVKLQKSNKKYYIALNFYKIEENKHH